MVMENNAVELSNHQEHHQRIDLARLSILEQKLTSQPCLLSQSAGSSTCSIFKIPQSFIDVNGKLYQPQIVSIGPYHYGKPQVQMIQEHKYKYLRHLLSRLNYNKPTKLSDLFNSVQPLESQARHSYSEYIQLDSHAFLEVMVVDGCFILELFRKVARTADFEIDDPVKSMSWIFSFLLRDLLKLENQIPFFILQTLFDVTRSESDTQQFGSLPALCLNFFSYAAERLSTMIEDSQQLHGQHLLDFIRTSFIPDELSNRNRGLSSPNTPSHIIHCTTKLLQAGIHLRNPQKQTNDMSFLSVRFKHGLIEMPMVTIDDFMSGFFANCVAYELSHKDCSTYFTTYATLLDCLVNTSRDVEYLCDHNIIENYFGTDIEVAAFINNLGKDVSFDVDRCYLAEMFNEVNDYCKNSWHVHWASFRYTYFKTPWSFISAVAALVLLVMAVLQTLYTMLPYYMGGS